MEYFRHGRSVIPIGGIFENINTAIEFVDAIETDSLSVRTETFEFTIDEEGYFQIQVHDTPYFISYPALKDLCRLLKLPVSFINKFPPSSLILENLNKNPYRMEDTGLVRLVIWHWKDRQVITGILPEKVGYIPIKQLLSTLIDYDVFQREETVTDAIVLNGEEMAIYFLIPDKTVQRGFAFQGGFVFHYSPTRASDTTINPFYKMTVTAKTGEPFDFDFESPKKLHFFSRRKINFTEKTFEYATQYTGENIGVDFETTIKRGLAARNLTTIKFSVLKSLKTRAASIYNYAGMRANEESFTEKIIPEYKYFLDNNREIIKQKEKFEINSMLLEFFIPLYFNRLFTFESSYRNSYFFIRYRQAIGKIFDLLLEEAGDIIL